jgi:NDP-sugar pyrophosphorylase family protein
LLKKEGASQVILCVGHLQEPLEKFVGDGAQYGLSVRYCADGKEPLGTGGAVLAASSEAKSPFIVLYGDSYLDVPIAPIVHAFRTSGKPALMTVYHNKNQFGTSNLLVKDSQIVRYEKENPTPEMEHIDFGLSIYSHDAFDWCEEWGPFDLVELTKILISQEELACYEVEIPFHEVGSPEGLKRLEEYLAKQL